MKQFNAEEWLVSFNSQLRSVSALPSGIRYIEIFRKLFNQEFALSKPPNGLPIMVNYDSGRERCFSVVVFELYPEKLRPLLLLATQMPRLFVERITPESVASAITRYLTMEAHAAIHEGINVDIYNLYPITLGFENKD